MHALRVTHTLLRTSSAVYCTARFPTPTSKILNRRLHAHRRKQTYAMCCTRGGRLCCFEMLIHTFETFSLKYHQNRSQSCWICVVLLVSFSVNCSFFHFCTSRLVSIWYARSRHVVRLSFWIKTIMHVRI